MTQRNANFIFVFPHIRTDGGSKWICFFELIVSFRNPFPKSQSFVAGLLTENRYTHISYEEVLKLKRAFFACIMK